MLCGGASDNPDVDVTVDKTREFHGLPLEAVRDAPPRADPSREPAHGPSYCFLCLRSFLATALAVVGLAALAAGLLGALPAQVPPVSTVPLCLLGLLAYCYELSCRHTWRVARTCLTGEHFAASAEAMRDAAPLVRLEVPGAESAPYELVQWRDETLWFDFGPEVRRGLVLASFPLEFLPGDRSEALALDRACARRVEEVRDSPHERDPALSALYTELRLQLRWPDGTETEEPAARLLISGARGAEHPYPLLLLLACLLLMGLFLDVSLVTLAEPVEWPIRKRFFTRAAGRLGTLSFSCSAEGVVEVDGDPQELRTANRFWLEEEQHWQAVHREVSCVGKDLIRFRWLRRAGQALAVLLVVAIASHLLLYRWGHTGVWLLLGCVLGALSLWGLAPLSDCLAARRLKAATERLGSLLPGGATVTANWSADPLAQRNLSIEVEQPSPDPMQAEEVPVLRTSPSMGKAKTASFYP